MVPNPGFNAEKQLIVDSQFPYYITRALHRFEDEGFEAYLVGGCVRDAIMGRPAHDWDIATSASPEDVIRIFPKTYPIGIKHGTVLCLAPLSYSFQVTTFRSDGEYSDGRHPDSIETVKSIHEDLSRRDFTMNAIALSAAGEIIDPFGGLEDIKKSVIRCVGTPDMRFREDALRMFRAFRFSAELGFTIEPETLSAIYANAERAKLISAERIREELEKTLVSQMPEIAGDMIKAGLLCREDGDKTKAGLLCRKVGVMTKAGLFYRETGDGSSACLTRGTVPYLTHAALSCPPDPILRWSVFCAALLDNGLIKSCADFMRDLRLDAKTVKTCAVGIAISDVFSSTHETGNLRIANNEFRIFIKRLLAKYGVDAVRCAAAAFDSLHESTVLKNTDEIIAGGECFSLDGLSVSGHDLIAAGFRQGPELGETLGNLLDHVITRPMDNNREVLLGMLPKEQ